MDNEVNNQKRERSYPTKLCFAHIRYYLKKLSENFKDNYEDSNSLQEISNLFESFFVSKFSYKRYLYKKETSKRYLYKKESIQTLVENGATSLDLLEKYSRPWDTMHRLKRFELLDQLTLNDEKLEIKDRYFTNKEVRRKSPLGQRRKIISTQKFLPTETIDLFKDLLTNKEDKNGNS
jgi:hypothetical protein